MEEDTSDAQLNEPLEIMDNYTKNLEHRNRAYSNRGSQYGKTMKPIQEEG
jgi:hypothetical protein